MTSEDDVALSKILSSVNEKRQFYQTKTVEEQ